ncbi:cupin domain-containing protein [Nonomuraea sp. NPDC050556]|uniref:cupin domain-containing protein n=1 Tax=Nonomuraea sp. NPDC050556 TaxID=3364369 RepID=UPI00379C8655
MNTPIALAQALSTFDAFWSPRIVGHVNDYDVRVAKVAGEYVWHSHPDTDEFFLVLDGRLEIALREDGRERTVVLETGSVFVVPRGTEHKPSAVPGASILLFEPTGTENTGTHEGELPGHLTTSAGVPL